MTRRPRTAGSRWRLLVHGVEPFHDVTSDAKMLGSVDRDPILLEATEFDELVVGDFLRASSTAGRSDERLVQRPLPG